MSLQVILDEIGRRWPQDLPDLAHMWALDITVALKPGQVYLNIGEVDDVIAFYNTFVDELNELAGEKVRNRCVVLIDGEPADTSNLNGGMQFMVRLNRNDIPMEICVTTYKTDDEYRASRYLSQGRNEIRALLDLGRPDIVRTVTKTDSSDHDVLECLGGIHAARQLGFSDDDIAGWFRRGNGEPAAEEAMSMAGIAVRGRPRGKSLRRFVPDNLRSLIRRRK